MEAKIKIRKVTELDEEFHIPNYQRGYKWRKKDVEYLIEDIAEIAEEDNSDYCLQPIVVAEDNGKHILVDGQQRLTTIWLIMNWASHNGYKADCKFKIKYDTRDLSNSFLKDIKEKGFAEDKSTCDTHYFSQALETIALKKERIQSFLNNLDNNVKIIWYAVDPKEGAAHFERLNNAKIGLTNAELVKAFLLTKSSQERRARMACEWDEMEYMLQNERFFAFITTKDSIYSQEYNRIELLIDLYTGASKENKENKEKDEYYAFNKIAKEVEGGKSINDVWHGIQNIYNRLLCWYNDNFLYNLIGYLVETRGDRELTHIWEQSKDKSTNEIKDYVRTRVANNMPKDDEIRRMEYKNGQTKNVLLLFNVLSLMSVLPNPNTNEYKYVFNDKFHFDLYKRENWDKEHVHATASESLQSKVEWVNWLKDLDEKLVEKELGSSEKKEEYLGWIKKSKEVKNEDYSSIKEDKNPVFIGLKKENFAQMFKDIVEAIEGNDDETDFKQNSIGNIVLLSENINRAGEYKVAPFSTKRRIVMERVKKGQFVPIGTQNVFMKVYTPSPGHFYKWEKEDAYNDNEKSDRDAYIDAIVETINRIK